MILPLIVGGIIFGISRSRRTTSTASFGSGILDILLGSGGTLFSGWLNMITSNLLIIAIVVIVGLFVLKFIIGKTHSEGARKERSEMMSHTSKIIPFL